MKKSKHKGLMSLIIFHKNQKNEEKKNGNHNIFLDIKIEFHYL